ncbi:hypothetical protein DV735_g4160, partial [Chaetothyriales sp. CBS 134920]
MGLWTDKKNKVSVDKPIAAHLQHSRLDQSEAAKTAVLGITFYFFQSDLDLAPSTSLAPVFVFLVSMSDFRITTALRLTIDSDTARALSDGSIDPLLDGLPLRLHLRRMLTAASAFGWLQAAEVLQSGGFEHSLAQLLLRATAPVLQTSLDRDPHQRHSFKIRILVSKNGSLEIEHSGSEPLKPPIYPLTFLDNPFGHVTPAVCKVAIAQSPTDVSLFTQHKTTGRSMYEAAYSSLIGHPLAPTAADVLLYNAHQLVTEATLSTVYFPNAAGTAWLTPDLECGGNAGTTRAWALEQGWCTEGKVLLSVAQQMNGQTIWLSNAVRGFWPASICLVPEEWEAHLRSYA